MTDWLDAKQVKASLDWPPPNEPPSLNSPGFEAYRVLEAIAALPEPGKCFYDACDCDCAIAHRIWRIARIICGKDATP